MDCPAPKTGGSSPFPNQVTTSTSRLPISSSTRPTWALLTSRIVVWSRRHPAIGGSSPGPKPITRPRDSDEINIRPGSGAGSPRNGTDRSDRRSASPFEQPYKQITPCTPTVDDPGKCTRRHLVVVTPTIDMPSFVDLVVQHVHNRHTAKVLGKY